MCTFFPVCLWVFLIDFGIFFLFFLAFFCGLRLSFVLFFVLSFFVFVRFLDDILR